MRIKERYFADGGLAHNNPSFAIYFHYTSGNRKKGTQPGSSAPSYSPHGTLDCSCVRFTNIGTGAKVDEVEPGKRERLVDLLIPSAVRKGWFLKETLTDIATSSGAIVETMRHFQYLDSKNFMYERFDASHGVSNIKLDDYKALDQIKAKTELYLKEQETIDLLEEVGLAIATDYKANPTVGQHAQANNVDESHNTTHASDAILPSSTLSIDSVSQSSSSIGELRSSPSDGPYTNGLLPLTGQQEGTKSNAMQYDDEDSGLGTIEPKIPVAVAAA